jgi:polysaccharide deacetylase family protein (PEP-CTERM system associated)
MQARDFAALPERITFTVDVEDHAGASSDRPRYPAMTRRILEFLAERDVLATFFVVGDVAERTPALVREIARHGHEIASHSHRHRPLPADDPRAFRRRITASKRLLEDLAGTPVLGFRAPLFSLVPASAWALDVLVEAGFAYSSSVVPARSFGFGWAGAPTTPFCWPNGLLELPCPVGRVGFFRLPFLGGMYLRYLPPWRLRQASRSRSTDVVWTYCHPYDFDTDEPFRRLPGTGLLTSFFLWWNRGLTLHRLDAILRGRRTAPFRDLHDGLRASADPFIPAPAPSMASPLPG